MTEPTDAEIDVMVAAYLGDCGPQATRVYSFARAVLAKWGTTQPARLLTRAQPVGQPDAYAAGMGDPLVVAAPTPQPAAQDAEPDMFWDADNREIFAYDIEEIVSEYDPGSVVTIECARRLPNFRVLVTTGEDENSYEYVDAAIAAQQGDSHE